MTSLQQTLARLERGRDRIVLQEVRHGHVTSLAAAEVLDRIGRARTCLRDLGLGKGDRCVLLAPNSANWVAITLALRAEGVVSVPLQTQRPFDEIVRIVDQAEPRLVCSDDPELLARLAARATVEFRSATVDDVTQAAGQNVAQGFSPAISHRLSA
jgi:long-subunit acyl-CoA synthetase (AMP-forming)